MLMLVKKETQKLLTFLLSDFGITESRISVVFSGGRGYHIHVRDPSVFALGSDERREIVDYLTGRGLAMERFIQEAPMDGDWGKDGAMRSAMSSGRCTRMGRQDQPSHCLLCRRDSPPR